MNYHNVLIVALATLLGFSHNRGYTPVALAVFFLFAGAVAYVLYARDKTAATEGAWRASENTLHVAALLFGWPGALIAQHRLRHKTKKKSFPVCFWLTVLLNRAGIAWVHTPQGNNQLRHSVYQLESIVRSHIPYTAPVSAIVFSMKFRTKAVQ